MKRKLIAGVQILFWFVAVPVISILVFNWLSKRLIGTIASSPILLWGLVIASLGLLLYVIGSAIRYGTAEKKRLGADGHRMELTTLSMDATTFKIAGAICLAIGTVLYWLAPLGFLPFMLFITIGISALLVGAGLMVGGFIKSARYGQAVRD